MTPGFSRKLPARLAALLAAAVTLLSLAVLRPAAADAATGPEHGTTSTVVAREVAGLLAHNPGSVQISASSVQTADGATISVVPNSESGSCPGGYLCLFWDSNFNGDQLTLGPHDGCATYNLSNYFGSSGHSWADEASSADNPSPRPGSAYFYHAGSRIYALGGGHYLKDMASDTGTNGHVLNDYIDKVQTC